MEFIHRQDFETGCPDPICGYFDGQNAIVFSHASQVVRIVDLVHSAAMHTIDGGGLVLDAYSVHEKKQLVVLRTSATDSVVEFAIYDQGRLSAKHTLGNASDGLSRLMPVNDVVTVVSGPECQRAVLLSKTNIATLNSMARTSYVGLINSKWGGAITDVYGTGGVIRLFQFQEDRFTVSATEIFLRDIISFVPWDSRLIIVSVDEENVFVTHVDTDTRQVLIDEKLPRMRSVFLEGRFKCLGPSCAYFAYPNESFEVVFVCDLQTASVVGTIRPFARFKDVALFVYRGTINVLTFEESGRCSHFVNAGECRTSPARDFALGVSPVDGESWDLDSKITKSTPADERERERRLSQLGLRML